MGPPASSIPRTCLPSPFPHGCLVFPQGYLSSGPRGLPWWSTASIGPHKGTVSLHWQVSALRSTDAEPLFLLGLDEGETHPLHQKTSCSRLVPSHDSCAFSLPSCCSYLVSRWWSLAPRTLRPHVVKNNWYRLLPRELWDHIVPATHSHCSHLLFSVYLELG